MANKRKIINDPVFGFISIPNELIFDVLQHPYVQRLNRIRQLGLSYVVYPGAQHSRFLHSIGAMHLMSDAIASLRQKGIAITDDEANGAMIAILLHDLGHAPFSHVMEHTLIEGITHEDVSLIMMEQINREMHGALDTAIAIFTNKYSKHFLHQLISSQFDMDRMDYLCRDSFFTGVTEGSVASARLIKMLNVVDDHLVIEAKGIYSVEKFLIARRLMYWQVYLHKTSVAAEQLLIKILERAKQLAREGVELFCPPALHYFLYQHMTGDVFAQDSYALQQYALLDDSDILSAIKAWQAQSDTTLRLLAEAFVNRRLFKGRLLEQPLTAEERNSLLQQYAQKFGITASDAEYFITEHVSTSNTYSEKDDSIDILYNDGKVRNIAEASEMLNLQTLTYKPQKLYLFYYNI
ncbi:MAG: HD domain-containing protein [Paludibacteraceae bacterium]|nr:HD domain-containing protein [Paludibacteraceae bacterium]